MALAELTFTGVDNASSRGTVVPALRGWPAKFLAADFTASALVQDDGQDWVATADGFVRVVAAAAKLYVRICEPDDDTDAAQGAAHPVLEFTDIVLSYKAGQKMRIAAG